MMVPRQSWCFCAVCLLANWMHQACAAQPPEWRPFRTMIAQPMTVRPGPTVGAGYAQSGPIYQVEDSDDATSYSVAPMQMQFQCPPYAACDVDAPGYFQPTVPYFQPNSAERSSGRLFELLPSDLIWHSYWAGSKEPRTSAIAFEEFSNDISLLDVSLGGRTAVLRDAARNDLGLWRGWELQIEGGALLRLNLDQNWDFDSVDFRFGVPLILAREHIHYKLAYYHLSSHVGDEFLERNPAFTRINFSRDVLVAGASYFPMPAVRLYGESGYAIYEAEGADQWEFQFGMDVAKPGPTGRSGSPFFAINGHLREELGYGGNLALQTGWLWRGATGRLLRTGLHYYNGKSPQYEFFNTFEQQVGFGLWQEY